MPTSATRPGSPVAVRQGVTTVVGGPDGGLAPDDIRRLIDAYEARGIGTNVAVYVGHNAIRRAVMGGERRPPSGDEVERMRELVREDMELGAVGLSTGLMYEPGMFSDTDEVIALAEEVGPYGGIYDSHVRDPVHALVESDREAIGIGRAAGIPAKIGHLEAVGLHNAGKIREVIALVEEARARGEEVVSDQYPYDGAATSTLTGIIVATPDVRQRFSRPAATTAGPGAGRAGREPTGRGPGAPAPGGRGAGGGETGGRGSGGRGSRGGAIFALRAALRDPATRARLKEASENGIDGGSAWLKATGYSSMRITSSADYPELVGEYLSELADDRGQEPFDLVAELILGADQSVGITLGAIREDDVRELMAQPWNMIASDGGYSDGVTPRGHPRSTGTFPRVLRRYVREWQVLALEEAVRKMTSLPAEFVRLADRGRLVEGHFADLAIFDPETTIDRSTWAEPHRFAEGVVYVLVNGVPVLRAGEMTGDAPGRFLRRSGPD